MAYFNTESEVMKRLIRMQGYLEHLLGERLPQVEHRLRDIENSVSITPETLPDDIVYVTVLSPIHGSELGGDMRVEVVVYDTEGHRVATVQANVQPENSTYDLTYDSSRELWASSAFSISQWTDDLYAEIRITATCSQSTQGKNYVRVKKPVATLKRRDEQAGSEVYEPPWTVDTEKGAGGGCPGPYLIPI